MHHAVHLDLQVQERVTAQHRVHRPQHRLPFAAAEAALLLVAPVHHRRVEADARIVHEDAAVDFADVHCPALAGDDGTGSGCQVRRHANVPREVVERPHGKDAERDVGAGQRRGDRIHRAVAARRHHCLGALPQDLAHVEGRVDARFGARVAEQRRQGIGIRAGAARLGIDDDA